MESGKTRFERFLELLDDEIKKYPHTGVNKILGKLLAAFHTKRLPLTAEDFKSFVLNIAQYIPPTKRFYVHLILDHAFKNLKEERGDLGERIELAGTLSSSKDR